MVDLHTLKIIRNNSKNSVPAMDSSFINHMLRSAPKTLTALSIKVKSLADDILKTLSFHNLPNLIDISFNSSSISQQGLAEFFKSNRNLNRVIIYIEGFKH